MTASVIFMLFAIASVLGSVTYALLEHTSTAIALAATAFVFVIISMSLPIVTLAWIASMKYTTP